MTTRFRSDDSGVRRVAMMGGAELVGADAAAVLIEGLHDRNAAVREAAARALGEHQGTAVGVAVIGALTDPEPVRRQRRRWRTRRNRVRLPCLSSRPVQRPGADRGIVFQQYSLSPWKTVGRRWSAGSR